ncbi:hypothetical protein BC830DRAFT_1111339 [Chytriomyces sp. MP71]|nr:hypothetical protein BC830DRAFT_1111339 [Chytriomyces sp. MP71]
MSAPTPDCVVLSNTFPSVYPLAMQCCQGQGVVCDASSERVTALFLHSTGLAGPVPSALTALASLTVLDLSSNRLTGPLPDLSALHLTNINVAHNVLSGPIPSWVTDTPSHDYSDNCFDDQPQAQVCSVFKTLTPTEPIPTTLLVPTVIATFVNITTAVQTVVPVSTLVSTIVPVATHVSYGFTPTIATVAASNTGVDGGGPSAGSIAGGVIVAILLIAAASAFVYWWTQLRRKPSRPSHTVVQDMDLEDATYTYSSADEYSPSLPPMQHQQQLPGYLSKDHEGDSFLVAPEVDQRMRGVPRDPLRRPN